MLPLRLESLAEVFAQVPDPRKPRGIRHPLQGMLALVFLGLLGRIREMAVLQRWAETHWHVLQDRWALSATSRRMQRPSVGRLLAVS